MNDFKLGSNYFVIVWKKGIGERNPIGYPVDEEIISPERRIEIPNGEVDTVVKIRIEAIESDRIIGRIVDHFESDAPEWEGRREVLNNKYDLETEITHRSGSRRLSIRATSDYENQWEKQKKAVFDEITDRN